MNRRALVIGSQVAGLEGVNNDVAAIVPRLVAHGFEIFKRIGADASRAGILAGLERLITDSRPGDAALIYYSGHGARVIHPGPKRDRANEPKLFHSLVPTDWFEDGFRGLIDTELSAILARLTAATTNVALILDCCHAARTWRGPRSTELVVRTLDRVRVEGFGQHLADLRTQGLARVYGESNPDAVRLVACEAHRSAFETQLEIDGTRRPMGILTAKLVEVLDQLQNTPISWRTLGMLVRERVMVRCAHQRPEVEGPGQRYLFELAVARQGGAVVYFRDPAGQHTLRASRLLGAERGARYALMAKGVGEYDASATVATAVVRGVAGTSARIDVEPRNAEVDVGALAFPLSLPFGKRAVRLCGSSMSSAMREAIGHSRYLRVAEDGEGTIMELAADEQLVLLIDGAPVAFPELDDTEGRQRTLTRLERWARAESLRNLEGWGARPRFEVEWGRVTNGDRAVMAVGETFHVGDRLYVELRNTSGCAVFFSLLDIGVDGTIALLTRAEPTGTHVEAGESYTIGLDGDIPSTWPADVPDGQCLPESLVVIVAAERHDMTALETDANKRSCRALTTELEQALDQLATGTARNFPTRGSPDAGAYAVVRLDLQTSPRCRGVVTN